MIGPRQNATQEAWLRKYRNYLVSASTVFNTLDDDEAIAVALFDVRAALKMLQSAERIEGVPTAMFVDSSGASEFVYA